MYKNEKRNILPFILCEWDRYNEIHTYEITQDMLSYIEESLHPLNKTILQTKWLVYFFEESDAHWFIWT